MTGQKTKPSRALPSTRQWLDALMNITDPQQRLAKMVECARQRTLLHPEFRVEEFRVQGCLARTWFVPCFREGRCYFDCDSDAVTLKALLGLFCEFYSGLTPEEIISGDTDVVEDLRVLHLLAENRQRTVRRIANMICDFAHRHAPVS